MDSVPNSCPFDFQVSARRAEKLNKLGKYSRKQAEKVEIEEPAVVPLFDQAVELRKMEKPKTKLEEELELEKVWK